jgi:predicted Rossmann fold nucleotide-binding protein DprA/Smf involved in DNA uptake
VRKAEKNEWCDITLVLPYTVTDIEYYESYYDSVLIPSELRREHPKHAITARNRYMVEISDLVIVYAEHSGGAYDAMKYAERMGKSVVKI